MSNQPHRIYLDKNLWKEPQPDGSEKWYAVHPKTGETVQIDPDQAWFWTEAWQAGERQADEDLAAGRFKTFDSIDELFDDLNNDDQ